MKDPTQLRYLLERLLWWENLPLVLLGVFLAVVTALGIVVGFVGASLL